MKSLRRRYPIPTSLFFLVAGLGAGAFCHGSSHWVVRGLADIASVVGGVWVRLLTMVALPLVATQLLGTILNRSIVRLPGLAVRALALFLIVLSAGGAFAAILTPMLVHLLPVEQAGISPDSIQVPESAREVASGVDQGLGVSAWLVQLIPVNPLAAFVESEILQVLVFVVLFGLAATRVGGRGVSSLAEFVEALQATIMVLVDWVLRLRDVGVFTLAFLLALATGLGLASLLVQYVLVISGILLTFSLLFYPVAVLVGSVRPGAFARAVLPAQLVGVTTRSSLAALPALIEGGSRWLPFKPGVAQFGLSFSAATLKANRTVSSTGKMLFLVHVYGLDVSLWQVATFVLTVMILSFSSVGIPGGNRAFEGLPAYIAVGIPVEGYLIVETVDLIPDIFKTLTNVTAYMAVTVILNRSAAD